MTHPVFTIMPDYAGTYGWVKDSDRPEWSGVGGSHADTCGWSHQLRISDELHQKFVAWQIEFESANLSTEDNRKAFDWVDYHRRGIELTKRLKAEVGSKAIVIYEKAYEDPCHQDAERREILEGGTVHILPTREVQKKASVALMHYQKWGA